MIQKTDKIKGLKEDIKKLDAFLEVLNEAEKKAEKPKNNMNINDDRS